MIVNFLIERPQRIVSSEGSTSTPQRDVKLDSEGEKKTAWNKRIHVLLG